MRYFIELAYNGANYHGWQVQPNAISVQEVLDDALWKALREKVRVVGAGRTDTGVHASYFVAHFDSETLIADTGVLVCKLNRVLPKDIVVYSVQLVSRDLHARFGAISRTYDYFLTIEKNPFLLGRAYRPFFSLDFQLMNVAAKILHEYSDFTSFSKLHTDVKTNNCQVTFAKWHYINDHWVFTIKADRFLRNMVRAIVGTLLEVGRGKIDLKGFRKVIELKNRGVAGASVPAEGLYLVDIDYPKEMFVPVRRKRDTI